jgi:methylenetetrahydrofolate reductase (NADPH)
VAEEVGVAWAAEQAVELLERGAPGIHFYTLNSSNATRRIFENLTRA